MVSLGVGDSPEGKVKDFDRVSRQGRNLRTGAIKGTNFSQAQKSGRSSSVGGGGTSQKTRTEEKGGFNLERGRGGGKKSRRAYPRIGLASP